MAAAPWIVSDELWELVEPLLPVKEWRFVIRVVSASPMGRRCAGSCSCCTRRSSVRSASHRRCGSALMMDLP